MAGVFAVGYAPEAECELGLDDGLDGGFFDWGEGGWREFVLGYGGAGSEEGRRTEEGTEVFCAERGRHSFREGGGYYRKMLDWMVGRWLD